MFRIEQSEHFLKLKRKWNENSQNLNEFILCLFYYSKLCIKSHTTSWKNFNFLLFKLMFYRKIKII